MVVDPRTKRLYSCLWSKTIGGPEIAPNSPSRQRLRIRAVASAYLMSGFVGLFGPFAYARHVILIEPQCASLSVVLVMFHHL